MRLQPAWSHVWLFGMVAVILSAAWAGDLAMRTLTSDGSAADIVKWQLVSLRSAAKRWLGLALSAPSFSHHWAAWSATSLRVTSWPRRKRVRGAFVCLVRNWGLTLSMGRDLARTHDNGACVLG